MNPSITVPVVVRVVISTACTHHLPAGCHASITEDTTLNAGQPVALTADQAAFALTLPGVVTADEPESDPIPELEPPAAKPPPFEEP